MPIADRHTHRYRVQPTREHCAHRRQGESVSVLRAHSSCSCATTDRPSRLVACTGFALRGWVGGSSARVRCSTLRAAQPASPPQRPAALATASQRLHCLGVSQCKVVRVRLAIGSDDTTRHDTPRGRATCDDTARGRATCNRHWRASGRQRARPAAGRARGHARCRQRHSGNRRRASAEELPTVPPFVRIRAERDAISAVMRPMPVRLGSARVARCMRCVVR